jgi:hypothetical protein
MSREIIGPTTGPQGLIAAAVASHDDRPVPATIVRMNPVAGQGGVELWASMTSAG